MGCRVGITTDPERRKQEWKRKYPGLRGWDILSTHYTKSAAQAREDKEAAARGCDSGSGGGGNEQDTWYVYFFRF